MTTSLPEVSAEGLVLWRVRRSPDVQVWCSVRSEAGGLVLTLHDPWKTRREVTKSYAHIGSLVESAQRVRGRLVAAGWQKERYLSQQRRTVLRESKIDARLGLPHVPPRADEMRTIPSPLSPLTI